MSRVAVVSACYGRYDKPLPPARQDTETDWVMVTDGLAVVPPPWRVIVEPRPGVHPRLAAKRAKACPGLYAPQAQIWIWADANLHITSSGFVSWCLDALGDSLFAAMPTARNLREEIAAVDSMVKYHGQPMSAQVDHYHTAGFPPDGIAYWSGLMVRSAACPEFGVAWLAEMDKWTIQDQLSLSPVLARFGITPATLAVCVPEVINPLEPVPDGRPFAITPHPDA